MKVRPAKGRSASVWCVANIQLRSRARPRRVRVVDGMEMPRQDLMG